MSLEKTAKNAGSDGNKKLLFITLSLIPIRDISTVREYLYRYGNICNYISFVKHIPEPHRDNFIWSRHGLSNTG
jgi:hypothetical protein